MKLGWKRLFKLADILDVADAQHKKKGEPAYDQKIYAHDCGSPSCALGHYAASNPRRGFKIKDGEVMKDGLCVLASSDTVQAEFSLSEDDAEELFGHNGCGRHFGMTITAKQAARYIRKFVKRKQAEAP